MPTIVNRIVAYAGYPGQTDATLADAFAAIPADIRAGTGTDQKWNIYIGPSAVGVYEWDFGGYGPTLTGIAANSTNNITISAVAGLSFKDNANKLTNALTYNAANGIALKATNIVMSIVVSDTVLEGLQFLRSGLSVYSGENALNVVGVVRGLIVKNCIVKSNSSITCAISAPTAIIANSLIVTASDGVYASSNSRISSTTIIKTGGAANNAVVSDFGAPTVKDLAAFGFSSILGGSDTSFSAASSNNATDLASGPTNWGAGSLVSRTFANQFQNIGSGTEDFRVKAGADLINAGTRDQTYTDDLDVVGTTRSITTPTIGAWEYAATVTYTYARPTSDITTQWTPSAGTDHYALIDEPTANDADYIYATAAGQTDEVRLAAMTAPKAGTDVLINYRVTNVVGTSKVTVSLICNTTVIATDTIRTAAGDYTLTVPATTWSSVADWSNMRLRFVSS